MAEQWGDGDSKADDVLDEAWHETVVALKEAIKSWKGRKAGGAAEDGKEEEEDEDETEEEEREEGEGDVSSETAILDDFADTIEKCRMRALEQVLSPELPSRNLDSLERHLTPSPFRRSRILTCRGGTGPACRADCVLPRRPRRSLARTRAMT